MVNKSKIGTLGQLMIPKGLREKHHAHEVEKVLLVPVDYCVIAKHPSSTMRGRPKGKLNPKNFEMTFEKSEANMRFDLRRTPQLLVKFLNEYERVHETTTK